MGQIPCGARFRQIVRLICRAAWSLLCDSMPERQAQPLRRHRLRLRLRIDTTWARLSWGVRLRGSLRASISQPFRLILRNASTTGASKTSTASLHRLGWAREERCAGRRLSFRRIIGVEVKRASPIAEENLYRLRETAAKCRQSICLDAREFSFRPTRWSSICLIPSPLRALGVIDNLRPRFVRHSAGVCHYNAPFEQQVLGAGNTLRRIVHTLQYEIYAAGI